MFVCWGKDLIKILVVIEKCSVFKLDCDEVFMDIKNIKCLLV